MTHSWLALISWSKSSVPLESLSLRLSSRIKTSNQRSRVCKRAPDQAKAYFFVDNALNSSIWLYLSSLMDYWLNASKFLPGKPRFSGEHSSISLQILPLWTNENPGKQPHSKSVLAQVHSWLSPVHCRKAFIFVSNLQIYNYRGHSQISLKMGVWA